MKALGKRELPKEIEVGGRRFAWNRTFKDDFFAVTAVYEEKGERVLLKVNRQASFFGFPLRWVGRFLANREAFAFERLRETDGIPMLIEKWSDTGIVREFVPGHPLAKGERVSDDFHGRLRKLIDQIHACRMAYVDLEKCENVLVGDDGKPYLFDFQIAWHLPRAWGGELWPMRRLRQFLQDGDLYHLSKLLRRTRPDLMSPEELAASYRKPWYVRFHRFVTWPFTWVRRKILDRIDPKRKGSERGRVSDEKFIGVP